MRKIEGGKDIRLRQTSFSLGPCGPKSSKWCYGEVLLFHVPEKSHKYITLNGFHTKKVSLFFVNQMLAHGSAS